MASVREVPAQKASSNSFASFADGVDAVSRNSTDGWYLLTKGDKSVWAKEWSRDARPVETLATRFPSLGSGSEFTKGLDAISHNGDWFLLIKGNKSVWAKEWSRDARPVETLATRFPSLGSEFTDGVDAVSRNSTDGWYLLTKGNKSVWAKEWSRDARPVETLATRFPSLGSGSEFTKGLDAISHNGDWFLLIKGNKSVWAKEWSDDARPVETLATRFPSLPGSAHA